ncbi:disulfide bond formation protein DsbA [Streptomyces sp. NPDC048659]|uniref:mycothiol-dependent nitroreductase Rv2466c family protein n=1 Tax=Streptomyces sp. NPDC048659 TaxID=3155489 RepID=UPI00342E65B8
MTTTTAIQPPPTPTPTPVTFYFDPLCPWTWITSRWLVEVEARGLVAIDWNVMSLAILNEDRLDQIPEQYRELLGPKGWRPVRALVAVKDKFGNEAAGRLYTELGERFHPGGEAPELDVIRRALEAAGLPEGAAAELFAYVEGDTYDGEVRASHEAGQAAVGEEAGSPVLALPGPDGEPLGFFGPILSRVPRGEAAERLWEAARLAATVPGFAEFKRARSEGPLFD